ncbi:GTPase HflX [Lederbergia wuyishanensis]|uniref:GTPase HflX n=1 Tax=Lederbergia wuyishanensis TaxID=1347903 RepID=A0ABU0D6B7_9BACI|nr:GTPase HflX [Lederbergia wuyishanensis]MCJ8008627.1 GTPase HflX [Lederbergia wuyishanensis]MDQ0343957.1 GTP-binding protein HflX [Lederbergia wuyishanensis]
MERKAIVVGVNRNKTTESFKYSMEELCNLAQACDVLVLGEVTQNLNHFDKTYYIGSGKVEELLELIAVTEANIVIFDDELSPSQIRNLESKLDCEVIDRTTLILEIFASRARTKEAQLQVEIARLNYTLPRLIGSRESLGRQGGGSGLKNRGTGETKLELDRRKIEIKIAALTKELEQLVERRKIQRKQRDKNEIPVVSLVGYTNAGKSTLMNAMLNNAGMEKYVFEKDMLFATLETSVRKINLANNKEFLLTDTVGFINKLPHHLVKAFRSTLEEVTEADLLVHVIDYSNPHHEEQKQLTNKVLKDIGVENIPIIYAYNKADLIDGPFLMQENSFYLSAKTGEGVEECIELISQHIFNDYISCEFLIPYTDGTVISYFNEHSQIISTEYEEDGTKLIVECKKADAEKYQQYIQIVL